MAGGMEEGGNDIHLNFSGELNSEFVVKNIVRTAKTVAFEN